MKKSELTEAIQAFKNEIKVAMQTMYDELNRGQQKQIVKSEKVKALFDRYGVEYSD